MTATTTVQSTFRYTTDTGVAPEVYFYEPPAGTQWRESGDDPHQVTVHDGDTIAIGGFIQDTKTLAQNGIPFLQRIPGLGALFGSKSYSDARTELIIFLTPRVIYDTNQVEDATDEIKGNLKRLMKSIQ